MMIEYSRRHGFHRLLFSQFPSHFSVRSQVGSIQSHSRIQQTLISQSVYRHSPHWHNTPHIINHPFQQAQHHVAYRRLDAHSLFCPYTACNAGSPFWNRLSRSTDWTRVVILSFCTSYFVPWRPVVLGS